MNIISNLIEAHIFREQNGKIEFLLLKRSPNNTIQTYGKWFPEKLKRVKQHIRQPLREIKEETSLTPEKFWVAPTVNSFYCPG